jgi:hypothetical protein
VYLQPLRLGSMAKPHARQCVDSMTALVPVRSAIAELIRYCDRAGAASFVASHGHGLVSRVGTTEVLSRYLEAERTSGS